MSGRTANILVEDPKTLVEDQDILVEDQDILVEVWGPDSLSGTLYNYSFQLNNSDNTAA